MRYMSVHQCLCLMMLFLRLCLYGVEFFTDPQLSNKLDKLMDERQQLLRMNDIIKHL